MFPSIGKIVEQFKQHWTQEISEQAIENAVRGAGRQWRDRKLNPVTTVQLFFLQILYGNAACNFLPHLARRNFTGSAYCTARGKLPLEALETLLTRATAKMAQAARDAGLWLGHRLFFVDGSSFSMSDTDELREHFGQPGGQAEGCGFPTASWLALVHFGSGLFQKAIAGPLRHHDMSGVTQIHPELKPGDVLLGDRAFCSFAHLALLVSAGIHGIFRAHQKLNIDFTPGRPHQLSRSGRGRTKGLPSSQWIAKLGPMDQIVVRELRYKIARAGFRVREVTLVTTLLDARLYPAEDLAAAYGLRWSIETNFDHIKTTMKMDVLRCKTVEGVLKELTMFLLAYNLVRMVMLEAADRQGVPVERISFIDALRWLATAQPGDPLPELVVNPARPGRVEPRARKRRPKQYDLMNRPREVLRKLLLNQEVAA